MQVILLNIDSGEHQYADNIDQAASQTVVHGIFSPPNGRSGVLEFYSLRSVD